jgi:hypothetical protein
MDVREQLEATHLRLFSIAATVDFDLVKVENSFVSSSEIEFLPAVSPTFNYDFTFTSNSGLPLFIL